MEFTISLYDCRHELYCSDVERGQNLEAEVEAEAKNNYEKSTK